MAYDRRNDYPVYLTEIGRKPPENMTIFVDTKFTKHDFKSYNKDEPKGQLLTEVKQWLEAETIEYRVTFHPDEVRSGAHYIVGFWFRTKYEAIRYVLRWKGIA